MELFTTGCLCADENDNKIDAAGEKRDSYIGMVLEVVRRVWDRKEPVSLSVVTGEKAKYMSTDAMRLEDVVVKDVEVRTLLD